jgi:hypothetical protein
MKPLAYSCSPSLPLVGQKGGDEELHGVTTNSPAVIDAKRLASAFSVMATAKERSLPNKPDYAAACLQLYHIIHVLVLYSVSGNTVIRGLPSHK